MQGDINKWKYSEIILLFGSLKKMEKRNQNTFFFFLSFEKLVQQHLRWSYKNRIAAKAWHKLSWLKFIFQNNTVNEKKYHFYFYFYFPPPCGPHPPSLDLSLHHESSLSTVIEHLLLPHCIISLSFHL